MSLCASIYQASNQVFFSFHTNRLFVRYCEEVGLDLAAIIGAGNNNCKLKVHFSSFQFYAQGGGYK